MKAFPMVAVAVVVGLYVPYFFLPVMDYRGPILGTEGLLICFIFPPMWLIALGHLALWFGLVALVWQRWRWARNAAWVALIVSFQSWGMMIEGGFPGLYFKLASMSALLALAILGGALHAKATRTANFTSSDPGAAAIRN